MIVFHLREEFLSPFPKQILEKICTKYKRNHKGEKLSLGKNIMGMENAN